MDSLDEAGDPGVIVLPERPDAEALMKLRDTLQARRGSDLSVDASGLGQLNARTAQLLVTAANAWAVDGHTFRCEGLGQAALTDLATLGLEPGRLSSRGWECP